MLLPYQVDTLFQRTPWVNVGIVVLNVVCFGLLVFGVIPDAMVPYLVLSEWNFVQFIGHQFIHAGFWHLVFNMIYLWVFGNAVCAVMSGWLYPVLYLALGILAGVVHLLADGSPVVGASGAISGVMGVYLAVYPTNKIDCWYLFFVRVGTFEISGWILILFWFAVDLFHAFEKGGHIAYWAHVGGTVTGFVLGIICLKCGLIDRTEIDHPTVLELIQKTE